MATPDQTVSLANYFVYRDLTKQLRVGTEVPEGCLVVAGPRQAPDWQSAKNLLTEDIRQYLKTAERAEETPRASEPVFKSAYEALVFAFRYAGQQSPKTPMSAMMQQRESLGSGRGLSGLDGAGQAGMVLSALRILTAEQRHVIVARFGDIRRNCPCCGQPAPDQAWNEAVEALSLCGELHDLPKQVRRAAIEKAVCRKAIRFHDFTTEYGLSPRTLRHKTAEVRQRLGKVENQALAHLEDFFEARGVLIREA
jgi:hypothetical protein